MNLLLNEPEVYTSIPNKVLHNGISRKKDYISCRADLRNFLEQNQEKWFPAKALAKASGFSQYGSQVELRKAITELLENYGVPIISSEKGFKQTKNNKEIIKYQESLSQRKLGLERRIKAVESILNSGEV